MARSSVLKFVAVIAWCALGGVVSLLALYIVALESRSDLSIWHETDLDAEFTVDSKAEGFADYLSIEARVFDQLNEKIVDRVPVGKNQIVNRYSRGSLSDPTLRPKNWNRTYELPTPSASAGVLLLHGMSDSPYSLRKIGHTLHENGAWVLGLRFPGHGTAPSGLTHVRWQDMAKATLLAMVHLREKVGDKPIYIVGYSAGGALAIHYALQALEDRQRPRVEGIVLISPAIGVSSLAIFAVWQARIGYLLGLDKMEWTDIKLEYDPYKYNSFAANAGDQTYRLTEQIYNMLEGHKKSGKLADLPSLLSFQSSVDATVSSQALVERLFNQLSPAEHELMLFDIKRQTDIKLVIKNDPAPLLDSLYSRNDLPYTLSVVSNSNPKSPAVIINRKPENSVESIQIETGKEWPGDVYSLSHIALPFSKNDPLYGIADASTYSGIRLGKLALRGERGTLRIPPGDMLRLRWNPFYSIIEERVIEFIHSK